MTVAIPSNAADCSDACRSALAAANLEITDLKALNATESAYTVQLKGELLAAYGKLEKTVAPMPWYWWTLLGAAGASLILWRLK